VIVLRAFSAENSWKSGSLEPRGVAPKDLGLSPGGQAGAKAPEIYTTLNAALKGRSSTIPLALRTLVVDSGLDAKTKKQIPRFARNDNSLGDTFIDLYI